MCLILSFFIWRNRDPKSKTILLSICVREKQSIAYICIQGDLLGWLTGSEMRKITKTVCASKRWRESSSFSVKQAVNNRARGIKDAMLD